MKSRQGLSLLAVLLFALDPVSRAGVSLGLGKAAARRGGSLRSQVNAIAARGALEGLSLRFERATPEQIGLYLPVTRPFDSSTTLTVRYKRAVDSNWNTGHPLLRIHPGWIDFGAPQTVVDAFAGSLFDLRPDTLYDIELTVQEPGRPARVSQATRATRALPPAAGAPNKTATPADIVAQLAGLNPGDVLELQNGVYNDLDLQLARSGTEANPIYIRGASRAGVVINDPGRCLQILDASHVVFENMTLQGSGVNSGTAASSTAVSFWDGAAGQTNVTFRDLTITGVDVGIVASAAVYGVLVYHCRLTGNNTWIQSEIETNATWNDDGIRLPGEGNCAWNNTLRGFGDCFAVIDGVHSSAVYYYRNLVTMTGDDGFEADYGTRNLAFYDNHITNCGTLLSVDPVWGGPVYCFRNVAINTMRGPYKLNSTSSGFLIYNNTVVRTEGKTGWGWVQFNNGTLRNWAYRNNVLVYRGVSGVTVAIESGGNSPIDFTNNAWFPDGSVWWSNSGASYGTVTAAIAGAGQTPTTPLFGTSTQRHHQDVVTTNDPFTPSVTLGATHLDEVTTTQIPVLTGGSSPQNAGTPIPNITDGYSGAAPDMGAVIAGRAAPVVGD